MGNCIGKSKGIDDIVQVPGTHSKDSFVDVMFFPEKYPCKTFLVGEECTKKSCKKSHEITSLMRLIYYLEQAKKTLDICVFSISNDEISGAVLAAHKRGVKVRVITDDQQAKGTGSDVQKFRDAGIPVRDDQKGTYMHNKFCIIDNYTLLNGSFNWSRQAVTGNCENLVINAGGPIIGRFSEYYENLWVSFDPKNHINAK